MKRLFLVFLSFAIFTLPGFAQSALHIGVPAPLFSLTALDGGPVVLDDLKGSVVVLTFWSTTCEICRSEFPKLNKLVQSFDSKKVVFVAPTVSNEPNIQAFLRKNQLDSRILPNRLGLVLQYSDHDRDGNIDMGFPAFFVIDQRGFIQYRGSGYDKTAALGTAIKKLTGQ